MIPAELFYFVSGAAVVSFLILFGATSIRESNGRAAALSFLAAVLFAACWTSFYCLAALTSLVLWLLAASVPLAAFGFFLPLNRPTPIRIDGITSRVDERDVIFAREEYLPGTDKYETYYALRPEKKAVDDKLRGLPELLAPGGLYYDPLLSGRVTATFRVIESMLSSVDGAVGARREEIDPQTATRMVKSMALRLGADSVGIARLDPMFVYSHVGRGPEEWGAPIETTHDFAVVMAFEMDYDQVAAAPRLPITDETAVKYLKSAQVSIALAQYLRTLGHGARAHIAGSNYQILLTAVGHDAGLGELGRMGYLVSPEFGARFRLGALTTDLPLVADKPVVFGVQDFCALCKKCAYNCPSGAIPLGGEESVRGVKKWQLEIEKCLHYWRVAGTDCGLCMKVCPYSHKSSFVHNLVRYGIKDSAIARRLALWGDDLFYGKKENPKAV